MREYRVATRYPGLALWANTFGRDPGRSYSSTEWEWRYSLNGGAFSQDTGLSFYRDVIHFLGFAYVPPHFLDSYRWGRGVIVIIPFWFLVLLTGLLPLRCVFLLRGRWRREKRLALGQCEHSGYDLLASPVRCPECGASP
jgi:hypothetical protein